MATPNQYVQTPTFYQAGSGNIVGATTVNLTSMTDIYGNILTMSNFGTTGYFTAEPDTTNEEGGTFTGITANANGTYTLTGVKTILAKSPYTQTSGLIRAHAGGTKIVITDNVAFWNTFANKANDETITGTWTFSNFPISPGNPAATPTVPGIATLKVNNYAADTGSANTYAIAPSPVIASYVTGQIFTFLAANTNTTTSTLNVNGIGVITIKKNVSTNLSAGDIVAGAIVAVEYDGTNFQLITAPGTVVATPSVPNIQQFSSQNTKGSTTTQFTITNTSGTTYRYTYTGTGTSPGDFTTYLSVGQIFSIQSTSMNVNNTGLFTVTAVQPTYIEVTNASGVAEATKTLANGYLDIGTVYTPTANTKYIEIEMVAGGASGVNGTGASVVSLGGGAGGYLRKRLSSSFSGLQAIVGPNTVSASRSPYGLSAFGPSLICNGAIGAIGGTATGGDVNIAGSSSGGNYATTGGGNPGASSPLGGAGAGATGTGNAGGAATGNGAGGGGAGNTNTTTGGVGTPGIIIITEHFI